MQVAIRDLKVGNRVKMIDKEKLVSIVLSDRVFLRNEDSITNSARLLFTKEFGDENTIERIS
jgi:hypothetical protein